MAQWSRQYTGLTHETKIQDLEELLQNVIKKNEIVSELVRSEKLKAIRRLSERLLAARLKALRAKISLLTEHGMAEKTDKELLGLQKKEQELQTRGVDGIFTEFGIRKDLN